MPHPEHVIIDVADLAVQDASGRRVRLGELTGVHLLVLLRHRH